MSVRFKVCDPALLEKHTAAWLIVAEVLRGEAQPIHLVWGSTHALVFDLRVNLAQQQVERLLVEPIKEALTTYDVSVDWPKKRLVVQVKKRRARVRKERECATGSDGQESVGGVSADE